MYRWLNLRQIPLHLTRIIHIFIQTGWKAWLSHVRWDICFLSFTLRPVFFDKIDFALTSIGSIFNKIYIPQLCQHVSHLFIISFFIKEKKNQKELVLFSDFIDKIGMFQSSLFLFFFNICFKSFTAHIAREKELR